MNDFYYQKIIKKWHGFRLCAIDGSQFRLPNEINIVQEFGSHSGRMSKKSCSMALSSMYYDVLNEMVIDACLNSPHASERTLAYQHLAHADENDLILLDRGYPAFWLYSAMVNQDLHFCMRAKDNLEIMFKQFKESGQKETLVEVTPNKTSLKICQEKNLPDTPVKLRLIRIELKNEVEILVTTLLDKEQYPACLFKKLYHLRWGIEESYKRQKHWLEIENFSGKSALSVKQDYYAKIVTLNLTAMMVHESQKITNNQHKKRGLKYKINFAQALSKMKDNVVQLLLNIDLDNQIHRLLLYIADTLEAVRCDRSFVRNNNTHNKINHLCYKRCR